MASVAVQRILYIVLIVAFGLNFVPRMVTANGVQRWFVVAVPQPKRFPLADRPPSIRRIYGYPFACFFQAGHEFTTKEGWKLFLPSRVQLPITSRLSVAALLGNVGFLICLAATALLATRLRDLGPERR